jgi:hypothetical protein
MLLWSIKCIIISLLLIVLVHYLFSFFKSTLTIPKMRDLVNKPIERYNEIYTTIQDGKSSLTENTKTKTNTSSNTTSSTINDTYDMQNELKQFLQHLHKNDNNIESHSLNGNSSAFSSYS